MSGWFAVRRGITSHPLFKGKPNRLAVWLWLLDNVAWKDTTHDIQGKTVEVPRGSVCASSRRIASEVGIGHQVVRTALKRFESDHMVNTRLTHGKSVISLCNYDKYQSLEKEPNTLPNTRLTRAQHAPNTQKEQGNKVTTEEAKASLVPLAPKKRASRLSEQWTLPKDWGDWALSEGWPEAVVRLEAEKFKDFWLAKGGKDAAKLDWLRTWRNWMRNSKSPKAITGGPNGQSTRSHTADELIAIAAGVVRA